MQESRKVRVYGPPHRCLVGKHRQRSHRFGRRGGGRRGYATATRSKPKVGKRYIQNTEMPLCSLRGRRGERAGPRLARIAKNNNTPANNQIRCHAMRFSIFISREIRVRALSELLHGFGWPLPQWALEPKSPPGRNPPSPPPITHPPPTHPPTQPHTNPTPHPPIHPPITHPTPYHHPPIHPPDPTNQPLTTTTRPH